MKTIETAGMAIGVALACGFLVLASILLMSVEGTSVKVLVAVWLWLLPLLGLGAAAGWLVAKGVNGLLRDRQ